MASDVEYAWAAGFIDGEGHFGCRQATKNTFQISIQVHQKGREPLDKLQKIFGGKVYITGRPGIFKWSIQKREDVVSAYEKLKPYLSKVKQLQAEIAIAKPNLP